MTGAYDTLAALYDRLTDRDMDYDAWCQAYLEWTGLAKGMQVLEAGCGTGKMTARLLKRGLRVLATDVSEQMLTLAGQHCRSLGVAPVLVRCDMRALRAHRPVDAVLCVCDGVNYLTEDSDALAFFQSAFQALRPGGVLAFDVSSARKLRGMDGQVYYDDRQDVTCFWTNAFRDGVLNMELAFFVRQKDGSYRRFDETHRQRAYETSALEALLRQAGFDGIQTLDEQETPSWRRGRVHFLARKAKF